VYRGSVGVYGGAMVVIYLDVSERTKVKDHHLGPSQILLLVIRKPHIAPLLTTRCNM
jgi:hypothetical protein